MRRSVRVAPPHLGCLLAVAGLILGCSDGARPGVDARPTADRPAEDRQPVMPDAPSQDGGGMDSSFPRLDSAPEALPPDAPIPRDGGGFDTGPASDAGSIDGGPGCGTGSLCLSLRNAYGEEILRAQSCSAGSTATCGLKARSSLGCGGCQVWVTRNAELNALSARFDQAGCAQCFYGSPTGDRCYPTGCNDLHTGVCTPQGTCSNMEPVCPTGTVHGAACTGTPLYCTVAGSMRTCLCFSQKWSCS